MDSKAATRKAVEIAIKRVGSQLELARQLECSSQAISLWKKHGIVGAKRVLALAALSGVSEHLLRPDICGPPRGGRRGNEKRAQAA